MWHSQKAWDNALPEDTLTDQQKRQTHIEEVATNVAFGHDSQPVDFGDLAHKVGRDERFEEALRAFARNEVMPLKRLMRECALELANTWVPSTKQENNDD